MDCSGCLAWTISSNLTTPRPRRKTACWLSGHDSEGLGGSRDFIAGIENYFNDHFGFRKRLVRLNHHWKEQLFRTGGSSDAIVGRDGWLFYRG